MLAKWVQQAVLIATASSSLLVAGVWAQTQTTSAAVQSKPHSKKVDPQINAQFQKGNVKDFIKRFETDDREVFVKRREITEVLDLKPGMVVADIGAGTGLFTGLFAEAVGRGGKVYAVDVSKDFLDYIAAEARMRGQPQVETIRGTQQSTNLPVGSVDVAFLCDVYHHLENHEQILASIHQALRPRGLLVLVEFDRVEGKSTMFVLNHIRASQTEFRREIEGAGFQPLATSQAPRLKENFIAKFQKTEKAGSKGKISSVKPGGHE
ncbi:MAG: class I SAM-dependent methyltransferase [Isosphaeraceae bacterium]